MTTTDGSEAHDTSATNVAPAQHLHNTLSHLEGASPSLHSELTPDALALDPNHRLWVREELEAAVFGENATAQASAPQHRAAVVLLWLVLELYRWRASADILAYYAYGFVTPEYGRDVVCQLRSHVQGLRRLLVATAVQLARSQANCPCQQPWIAQAAANANHPEALQCELCDRAGSGEALFDNQSGGVFLDLYLERLLASANNYNPSQ